MNKLLVILIIFLFSISLRLWNLNQMGRAWDEQEYLEPGYRMIELFMKGDFDNPFFYTTYNHPPLVKYLYGIAAHLDVERIDKNGNPFFHYDLTYSRLLSATVSSLSVILIVLIGWHISSRFVGIAAGIVLAAMPFFLGLSQLVTAESFIMLFFSASFLSYLLLLERFSIKKVLISGILVGIALQIKQSNALLFPLFGLMYCVWYRKERRKNLSFLNKRFFSIGWILLISALTFILIWPTVLFHFQEIYSINKGLWHVKFSPNIWQITVSVPEVFFGKLMLTPIFYYIVYFLITTPALVLTLFFLGIKKIKDSKNWFLFTVIFWFTVPFLMSFYSWRQHGLRYIIEVYAPMALIAGVGLEYMIIKLTKKKTFKYVLLLCLIIYFLVILSRISPYYLDYFNILSGGAKGVYENKSFQIGWWGQGIREAGLYIQNNARKGSRVAIATSPTHVVPKMPELKVEKYSKNAVYDYVLINSYNILREGFDDYDIKIKYEAIYNVHADGAILATVYKLKK